MEFNSFVLRLGESLPEGTRLNNPGGGTSTVLWQDGKRICYQRGKSRFYVDLADLHAALVRFAGSDVTTGDLKEYAPEIFDSGSGGHNCHCTFFFLALERMGAVDEIWGRGRRGSPFGGTIPAAQADKSLG